MRDNKIFIWSQRATVFSFCALIYFLPISIALVEIFATIILTAYFVRHSVYFVDNLKRPWAGREIYPFWKVWLIFIRSFKPAATCLNWPIALFILANFLSVIFSQSLELSIKGFVFKLIEGTFLFFSFVECMQGRRRLRAFVGIFLISTALVVANGLFQAVCGYGFIHMDPLVSGRVKSSFRHANDFGGYLVVAVTVVLSMLWLCCPRAKMLGPVKVEQKTGEFFASWGGKGLLFLLLMASIICLGMTFSRGAWMGFLLALVFLGIQRWKQLYIPVLIAVVFMLFFQPKLGAIRNVGFITDDFQNEHVSSPPAATTVAAGAPRQETVRDEWDNFVRMVRHFGGMGRNNYWKEASAIIEKFPVFGIGINTYSKVAPDFKVNWGGYPHNCYLQMAAETGLIGLGTFLWIFVVFFVWIFKVIPKIRDPFVYAVLAGFSAGLFGFMSHSFVDTNFYSVQLGILLWVLMAVIVVAGKFDGQESAK